MRQVIEQNFRIIFEKLRNNVLALTTEERENLSSYHLSNGLRVYDTTQDAWYKYVNGVWRMTSSKFVYDFTEFDWSEGTIVIPFDTHRIRNPIVQVLMKTSDGFDSVISGLYIDENYNITISSNLQFQGRIVIG